MKKQIEATAETETSKAGENGKVLKASYSKAKAEVAVMTVQQLQIPKMEVKIVDEKAKAVASSSSAAEKWRAAVSMLPQLRGVDERAEEFISKFLEEMKIQRENSNLELQEMLSREHSYRV
ncbi:Protein of unknown function DUF761, plant [Dillenia turbinata]|uniref:Uncharacterized protein n=1 Tax=Dillenia turbinata TaxID=194707 RepID=A0AAN8UMR7_9MAGN